VVIAQKNLYDILTSEQCIRYVHNIKDLVNIELLFLRVKLNLGEF